MNDLGLRVGHWTNTTAATGCTVVVFDEPVLASAEVRGGAPASRELALLEPHRTVDRVDAIVLTGGSAFGLAAADGVMRYCAERGQGVPTPGGVVPIVPALALYDLAVGDSVVRPGAEEGYAAAMAATPAIVSGKVGAGTGATVGKASGEAEPGGLGTATVRSGELVVTALVAVNAFGWIDVDGTRSAAVVDAM
ncbi:P1 family peptidase, partial [Stackebrandtia soli]|uniref:P1 family peptidase n=1 Tax=Stackebrandtia soli TaxID=1892856 RepID=UPI0039ECDF9B